MCDTVSYWAAIAFFFVYAPVVADTKIAVSLGYSMVRFLVFSNAFHTQLILKYRMLVVSVAYSIGIMLFVMSLKKEVLKYQFGMCFV